MMQEDKLQSQMPKDTIYEQYEYYAALFAIQAKMHNEAIAVLEDLKNGEFEAIAVNQFLYQEYMEEVKDTVNAVRELQEAMVRFPQEPWFLQNLINYYIFSKQEDKAIEYLNQAIEREPGVAEYHLIKGNLSANQGNNAEALTEYDRALEINPMLAEAHAGKGRVHYNEASKIIEEATYIQDAKAYKAALNKASDKLKESLPFFEKALEVAPDNREYMVILKGIYYRLHMDDKYEAMQDMLNN